MGERYEYETRETKTMGDLSEKRQGFIEGRLAGHADGLQAWLERLEAKHRDCCNSCTVIKAVAELRAVTEGDDDA